MNDLDKKICVIAGGFGSIGYPITLSLLEKKYKVLVITSNKTKHKLKIKKLKKNKLFSIKILEEINVESLKKLKLFINKKFKKIDLFIDATNFRESQLLNTNSYQTSINTIIKNSKSIFGLTTTFVEVMKKNKNGGSLIMISSIYGISTPPVDLYKNTNFFTEEEYPFLKSGVIAYYKFLAKKYGNKNLRFNIICPGGLTNRNTPKNFIKNYLKYVPLKRMLDVNDLINLVSFISSDKSSYITGNTFVIDGGFSL